MLVVVIVLVLVVTPVVTQETLSELATLRSTLKDSDEVNQYKAKELKEKEAELQKLTEDLKVISLTKSLIIFLKKSLKSTHA